jgi:hypothetical protein
MASNTKKDAIVDSNNPNYVTWASIEGILSQVYFTIILATI